MIEISKAAFSFLPGIQEPPKPEPDVCIDVRDVSVMFNLSRNHEDGLKEYFINMMRGKIQIDEFWALRNINLQIKSGDSVAFIGRNGSGKSTLLKTISGIIKPTRGHVNVKGTMAPLIELSGGFDRSLSARENIYLSGAMHGHTRGFIDRHIDEIIKFAEIERFIDVPVKNFSSGMVSRLGFAIATSINADIIIADEVLAVGDAKFRQKCEDRIQEMLKGGTTILFVSHNAAQVKKVCKKAVWIEKGNIIEQGEVGEVTDKYLDSLKK